MVKIKASNGTTVLLPMHHFLGAEYKVNPETNEACLILDFAMHSVRVLGQKLMPIIDALQFWKAEMIQPSNVDTQALSRISSIEVAHRTEH